MNWIHKHRRAFSLFALAVFLLGSASQSAQAYYNPKTGKFMQRDPNGTAILVTNALGLVPNPNEVTLKSRGELCETIAIQFAGAVQYGNAASLKITADALVKRNPDLLSAAIRKVDGEFFFQTDNHPQLWGDVSTNDSTTTHVQLPIFKDNQRWANIELCFRPLVDEGLLGMLNFPIISLTAFMAFAGFLVYQMYLRSVLCHLDPATVIPERVQATLDTLAEGVLILDNKERIVLANEAFSQATGQPASELLGRKASQIPWEQSESDDLPLDYPWLEVANKGTIQKGVPLRIQDGSGSIRTFAVNAAPIAAADGRHRGSIATFDDVTGVEKKNVQLAEMLERLEESREKVRQKNEELTRLATRDPLTGCLNRRALFERFEIEWEGAKRHGHSLGCIIADIDHFKWVNDNHGHSAGDLVLKEVAEIFKTTARKTDIVCRYGGEEFVLLLPHANVNQTEQAADKLRCEVQSASTAGVPVTISLGVSTIELGAETPEALIDLADKALYAAKRTGRNQVVRADQMPANVDAKHVEANSPHIEPQTDLEGNHIPFQAVNSLVTALRYRDPETATHCRRVADLCVNMAMNLMSFNDSFVLEVSALLHDIGKIGVPDSILLKPGPLTDQEWKVMGAHDRMGIEIIDAAFGSAELTNIVRNHHAFFGGNARDPGLPTGLDIPLRARILSAADAFDAMVTDRVYQKSRNHEEAFAELRHCSGTQFDPALVELLIQTVTARNNDQSDRLLSASVDIALRIGLEIERVTVALDANDFSTLTAMTGRLSEVATKLELPRIAKLATELHQSVTSEFDLERMLGTTTELLDLCRSLQSDALCAPMGPV